MRTVAALLGLMVLGGCVRTPLVTMTNVSGQVRRCGGYEAVGLFTAPAELGLYQTCLASARASGYVRPGETPPATPPAGFQMPAEPGRQ